MRTVPAAAAAAYTAASDAARLVCGRHLVLVGDRPEVDLAAVAAVDPYLADGLGAWWSDTRSLWARAAAGEDLAGVGFVRTRRVLVDAVQSTAKGAKSDLSVEFDALCALPGVGEVLMEATAIAPVVPRVQAMAAAAGGRYAGRRGEPSAVLELPLTGSLYWPDALGGVAWPGEVSRTVVVGLRYAAWRDRRVRRVASVRVDVDELWAATPDLAA